ncbi:hypothetical protein BD410DRAFT_449165 [Rickenella mellea]|uniref:DUF6534 domain-containing protein n=1 Tax=Rickenella mellea TaxID=50990 RepID=A0A4Y7PVW9_9AGAM|nr:hypothetical protein BD410DRAFT_449165 [Rickenella mellea]
MSLDITFGAAFSGLFVGAIMYGLTLLQTYTYFKRYPRDKRFIRPLVVCLWFLDTLHLGLIFGCPYWYLIANFGDSSNLAETHWTMNLQAVVNSFLAFIIQLFFSMRVYRLGQNLIVAAVACILAMIQFSIGIFFTARSFALGTYDKFGQLTWAASLGLGSSATCDVVIAVSLCYFLRKNRTEFPRTNTLISTLMTYSINTGALTNVCALCSVISFGISPTSFIWLSFFWIIGKLYVNSFLAVLNSRERLRNLGQPYDSSFLRMSNTRSGIAARETMDAEAYITKTQTPISIAVETSKMEHVDDEYSKSPDNKTAGSRHVSFSRCQDISSNTERLKVEP